MSKEPNVTVRDNHERHRYEAVDETGVVAGFVTYRLAEDVVAYTHAEVDDAFEGQGIGSALAREALEGARSAGMRVRPDCPFVADYMDTHPEYQDLLAR